MPNNWIKILVIVGWVCDTGCYAKEEPVSEPATEFLHAAVRVNNPAASCGTIVGHKGTKVYVLSTGHMDNRTTPEVEVFYQYGYRLKTPIVLKGRIVFLVENGIDNGVDFSLIEMDVKKLTNFSHVSIVPKHKLRYQEKYTSIGCDSGVEPKEFVATPISISRSGFMIEGEVKPGRSGGGLFDPQAKTLVGVTWGGMVDGKGLVTSHTDICVLLRAAKYGFLIK